MVYRVIHCRILPFLEMEKLIPVINRLQDVFNTVGQEAIQLPQIAVVGTQSTGKSSVIENIVGRDFLPRGSGIVTRRPLILQLVHISEEEANGAWGWAKFLHSGDRTFKDFENVRAEIERVTEDVAGTNKGISSDPIRLRVYSPHVLNLTLIDLPGVTRVPVGDQPDDIEQQMRDMVLGFISNPNCIILAVHAANTDLTTSEALKLARETDRTGERTLVVCTKLDLMDFGTDAYDLLTGKVIPVKLGIIGVVNRSQQDIINRKPISDALQDEQLFFRKKYATVASLNGTQYLCKTLNKLLMQHIRNCLPFLRQDVSKKLNLYESQLTSLGEPVESKSSSLLTALTRFSTSYCQNIDGTARDIETNELSGGARICYIFHNTFSSTLKRIQPLKQLTHTDILHAVRNANGPRPPLFISEIGFELLVKKQIQNLLPPSLQCVELVYEELQRIIQYCFSHIRDFQRFPVLRDKVNTVALALLHRRLPITNIMVENLIAIELAYINTNHPDFVGGTRAAYEAYANSQLLQPYQQSLPAGTDRRGSATVGEVLPASQPHDHKQKDKGTRWFNWGGKSSGNVESMVDSSNHSPQKPEPGLNSLSQPTDSTDDPEQEVMPFNDFQSRQNFDCKLIENLISSYFLIVRKSIQDSIPKAVMHCLVNYVRDRLQSELVGELYKTEVFSELMEESPETVARRNEIAEMVKALQKAHEILGEIRDLQYESSIVGYTGYDSRY